MLDRTINLVGLAALVISAFLSYQHSKPIFLALAVTGISVTKLIKHLLTTTIEAPQIKKTPSDSDNIEVPVTNASSNPEILKEEDIEPSEVSPETLLKAQIIQVKNKKANFETSIAKPGYKPETAYPPYKGTIPIEELVEKDIDLKVKKAEENMNYTIDRLGSYYLNHFEELQVGSEQRKKDIDKVKSDVKEVLDNKGYLRQNYYEIPDKNYSDLDFTGNEVIPKELSKPIDLKTIIKDLNKDSKDSKEGKGK